MAFGPETFPGISAVRTGNPKHASIPGNEKDLFLKVFSGEVLTTFSRANLMRDLQTMRTISSGKSAQFPATGLAAAVYHTVGENILDDGATTGGTDIEYLTTQNPPGSGGTQAQGGIAGGGNYLSRIKHAERVISVDELLISAVFMADIDRMMNHYEERSIYSKEIGNALARSFDKRSIRALVMAARSAGNFEGGDGYQGHPAAAGGDTIVDSLLKTDGAAIVSALFEAAQIFDERDVPTEDRHFLCSPQQYYLIVQQKDVIDRDITSGTNGDFADGTVKVCAGFQLHKTNSLPSVGGTAPLLGENNIYYDGAGFADNAGVAFHTSAIGTVKLKDLSVETDRKLEYMGDLMVASYALGTGILRPESAVELSVN